MKAPDPKKIQGKYAHVPVDKPIEFEGVANYTSEEDGGAARIVMLDDLTGPDEQFFIRLHSWDESGKHETIRKLEGKRLKIKIEVIE